MNTMPYAVEARRAYLSEFSDYTLRALGRNLIGRHADDLSREDLISVLVCCL